jgi:hypothetical protein
MYTFFKRSQYILIYINIILSSLFFGFVIFLIIALPNRLVNAIYPFLVFQMIWAVTFYHFRFVYQKRWLFKRVEVIALEIPKPLPEKIEIDQIKLTLIGDALRYKKQNIHQKLIKEKDPNYLYTYPPLQKIHSKNEYKITAIYLEYAVVKDLNSRYYVTHLKNLEPIK